MHYMNINNILIISVIEFTNNIRCIINVQNTILYNAINHHVQLNLNFFKFIITKSPLV